MPLARYKKDSLINGKSYMEYYVIFERSEQTIPLLGRWLNPEYSHVWAVRWDGFNWIGINPALGYSDVMALDCVVPDIRIALASVEYTDIIHVSAWRKMKKWRTPWPVAFTCVEQIKALLGISVWWIVTPRQLYKYLGGKQ